jgi:hypothetical protein
LAWSLRFRFSNQNFVRISPPHHHCFCHPNNIWWRIQSCLNGENISLEAFHIRLIGLIAQFTDLLSEWMYEWMNNWLAGWFTDWLTDWLTVWVTGWLVDWLAD